MKKYLLCYYHWKKLPCGQEYGFANVDIEVNNERDIYTSEGIDEIIEKLINEYSYTGCVILNIIPLNG